MKPKPLLLISLFLLVCAVHGEGDDGLFSRLQGLRGMGVDFFNVDGIEITSHKIDAGFSAKNCAAKFSELGIKKKELTISDSLLAFKNFYVFKSQENPKGLFNNISYYFVESPNKKLIAFTFRSLNKNDREFERRFIGLVCNGAIPDSVYNSLDCEDVNFAGREIPLEEYSGRWMGVNNLQCPSFGQMNWSVHKDMEDALSTVENQYVGIKALEKRKIVSDTTVNVIFEGTEATARKVVYDFTGVRSSFLSMDGSGKLTIYFVAAPVRGNFVSCVMSFWKSDQVDPSGLSPLLEQVMKLKQ